MAGHAPAGPPDFIVGLTPIASADWLTPDWEAAWLPEKIKLIETATEAVLIVTPEAQAAAAEAATLATAALGQRPSPDFARANRLVSDDMVLMTASADGWRAGAVCLCSPTFFSAAEAIGKSLFALHAPVPDRLADGAPGLGVRVSRVFSGLRPGCVLERHNWTIQPSAARYTPNSEAVFANAHSADLAAARHFLHLRVERQTIVKLPDSGAVLFTIRVSLDPLESVFAVPGAQAALSAALTSAREAVRRYKKWDRIAPLIRAAFDPEFAPF